jgi:hypothetical protein
LAQSALLMSTLFLRKLNKAAGSRQPRKQNLKKWPQQIENAKSTGERAHNQIRLKKVCALCHPSESVLITTSSFKFNLAHDSAGGEKKIGETRCFCFIKGLSKMKQNQHFLDFDDFV